MRWEQLYWSPKIKVATPSYWYFCNQQQWSDVLDSSIFKYRYWWCWRCDGELLLSSPDNGDMSPPPKRDLGNDDEASLVVIDDIVGVCILFACPLFFFPFSANALCLLCEGTCHASATLRRPATVFIEQSHANNVSRYLVTSSNSVL